MAGNHGKKKHWDEIAFARVELGLTEIEWNQCHPCQAQSYIAAWEDRQKREAARVATIQLTIASSLAKKKGGGEFKLDDFLPEFCKPKRPQLTPEQKEERLKRAMMERTEPQRKN